MESATKDDLLKIYNFLTDLSCCNRCILRYLGFHISNEENPFQDPDKFFMDLKNDKNDGDITSKRIKKNPCPVCLNCFDPETLEKLISNSVRTHGMYLHLKKQFPQFKFKSLYDTTESVLEQAHKIFRYIAADILSKTLQKTFHPKSNFSLLITICYGDDDKEVENMKQIIAKKSSRRRCVDIEVSRNNIFEFLKDINPEKFENTFTTPPVIPEKNIFIEKVELTADPIYLGGRYLKFKRNVGQTPWVIDGVSVSEHNIQDIIFDAVCISFGCSRDMMTFCASGREDLDVRMLGTGRPFYIKIDNPKDRNISKDQLMQIEKEIIKTKLAAVIKLQAVYASELNHIKLGEEEKKKTYRALCKTESPNIKEAIESINKQPLNLEITQLTPMRVLHRRTLLARKKTIHSIKAMELPGHKELFEVEFVTQAGTYVKEFVHGDFNRTTPSLSSVVGYPTDLVALDCIDIELIWPEKD
ncbi:hypothetical protein GWI33_002340 [Rhynchophorus ferrugineus]|uniref:tRNA pseudouridine(55) synthase n=1 Tax=Rhynchophorus ferrugineus TaxID=354439 RepID=A0A834IPK5_RHYFE|nr:hypothetical protein GWI33_002340 [Rhynchophorus ferrugineus]